MTKPQPLLARLSEPALVALATAVEAGWLIGSSPRPAFSSIAGDLGGEVADWLLDLESRAFTGRQVACLLQNVIAGRQREQVMVPDLVLSGPDVAGVPTADTYTVVQNLFQEAQEEVVLAGYAFYNGRMLFERLAEQQRLRPQLKILFHVDLPRKHNDTASSDSIILQFAEEFKKRHWPWDRFPEVYFDPRALSTDSKVRASLHAKIVVVDRKKLFLTSANFTEAAHQKNIEMGLLCAVPYLAERVASYLEGLRRSGQLLRLP